MPMKFAKFGDRKKTQQHFDKEKIFLTKAGKTYNVYDAIQAANIDTDIHEVLKKYHCTTDEAIEFMKEKGGMPGIYGEFAELQEKCQTMQDVLELKKHADELFYNLPVEVRDKYGHNLQNFFKDLEKHSKKEQQTEPVKQGEVKNEQK